jgi:hypothetical protein
MQVGLNTCSGTGWIWEQVGVGMMGGAIWGLAACMLRLMRRGLPLCHGPLVTSPAVCGPPGRMLCELATAVWIHTLPALRKH